MSFIAGYLLGLDDGGKSPVLENLAITENGVYTPNEGTDGFDKVTVNVQQTDDYDYIERIKNMRIDYGIVVPGTEYHFYIHFDDNSLQKDRLSSYTFFPVTYEDETTIPEIHQKSTRLGLFVTAYHGNDFLYAIDATTQNAAYNIDYKEYNWYTDFENNKKIKLFLNNDEKLEYLKDRTGTITGINTLYSIPEIEMTLIYSTQRTTWNIDGSIFSQTTTDHEITLYAYLVPNYTIQTYTYLSSEQLADHVLNIKRACYDSTNN